MDVESTADFLTPEECAQVDRALMTSREKFSARVTIYALRSLRQIAQTEKVSINQLAPQQIEDWVYQDESLQNGIDREFRQFLARLVVAAQHPLGQVAQAQGVAIEALTVAQVVGWFEQQAKLNLGKL